MDTEALWKEEAERRVQAFKEGRLETIPYEDIQYELYLKANKGIKEISSPATGVQNVPHWIGSKSKP